MKTIIKSALIVLLFISGIFAQTKLINNNVFVAGEILKYKVKWAFLRIGTITIKTIQDPDNPDYIKVTMIVESNPDLPFINVKEYNETMIDLKNCMSVSYYGDHKNGDERIKIYSSYKEENGVSVFKMVDDVKKKEIKSDTIYNSPRYVEGPSLFFFTRAFSKNGGTYNVPTMIEGEIAHTKIIFGKEKDEFEVDAFDYPVVAKKYFGFADWEGGSSQGMSGDFTGWITNDDASIPVYAELKILLGNLKLELEYCNRNEIKYRTANTSLD